MGRKRKSDKITLAQFAETVWLPAIAKLRQSWTVDRNIARTYILPSLGEKSLAEIKSDDILLFLKNCRKQGRPVSTRNRILSVLRSIFAIAAKGGRIEPGASPMAHICNEALPPKSPRLLDPEELLTIMRELEQSEAPEAAFLRLMMLTNAGKAELLAARWSDFSRAERALVLKRKSPGVERSRKYLLSPKALEIVESLPSKGKSPWLFPGPRPDSHMTDIYYFWNNLREKRGFPGLRLHDLQMSFVVWQIRQGGHALALAEIFGCGITRHARQLAEAE